MRMTSGRRTHHAAQRAVVGFRIDAHLALIHDGALIGVQKLDRGLQW